MRPLATGAPLILLVVACTSASTTTSEVVTTRTALTATTVAGESPVTSVTLDVPSCLQGEETFTESGEIPTEPPDGEVDAAHIAGWELVGEEGCDRLTISLATEGGAPARLAGRVEAFLIRDLGVLRVSLDPAVTSTAVIDHVFESAFVERVFTVRSSEGTMFIDVHLGSPAVGRVFVDRSPATITIDLTAGGDLVGQPVVGDGIVVLEPSERRSGYPLEVVGYTLGRATDVAAQVVKGSRVSDEVVVAPADSTFMWGEYRLVISDGPRGNVDLLVGNPPVPDHTLVTIPLVLN